MPPSFRVTGGRPLSGTIRPAGNKNAALPILAATLLADGPCRIDNVPRIRDVETMLALLQDGGAAVQWHGTNTVEIDTSRTEPKALDPALCKEIRASILLAGPMLAAPLSVTAPEKLAAVALLVFPITLIGPRILAVRGVPAEASPGSMVTFDALAADP